MLQLDSIVTDLMFQAPRRSISKTLIEASAARTSLETKQLLDVDRLDPRAEMELSPSMPFRRRGERRLMIIDDRRRRRARIRQADPFIKADLRPFKEALIAMLPEAADAARPPVRARQLGRRGARRAQRARPARHRLLPWALDPQVDVDGKRRADAAVAEGVRGQAHRVREAPRGARRAADPRAPHRRRRSSAAATSSSSTCSRPTARGTSASRW